MSRSRFLRPSSVLRSHERPVAWLITEARPIRIGVQPQVVLALLRQRFTQTIDCLVHVAQPGQTVYVDGYDIGFGATLQVTVGGVPAQVISADQRSLKFRLEAGTTTGPISIRNEVGATELTGSFTATTGATHPGFFIVSGPSSVTDIVKPRPTLGVYDTLLVRGQNLARLNGICVYSPPVSAKPAGYITLRRVPIGGGSVTRSRIPK